ncbi:hypothetical protein FACS1894130_12260 [Spirochaetia bacterium]|nr:hypothetical protein FACS1894130_12260 [Spirochaetia bacterium]
MELAQIIKEFTEIINFGYMEKKEAIILEIDRYAGWYINPIIVNIDEDQNQEILALYGATERTPILLVFKQIENNWYLLYYEPFYIKYDNPELCVANNYSANKTFYVRCVHGSGSGYLHNVYHFYKLINGKVYPCLTLLHEANISEWALMLNQSTTADFSFNSMNSDDLWVDYRYNFYPGRIYEEDVPWAGHDDISFVTGTRSVKYIWDDSIKQYIPEYYDRPDDLTAEKIECFEDFGNDELFIKAFDYEIKKTLEDGTVEQKKVLKWYLKTIRNRSQ